MSSTKKILYRNFFEFYSVDFLDSSLCYSNRTQKPFITKGKKHFKNHGLKNKEPSRETIPSKKYALKELEGRVHRWLYKDLNTIICICTLFQLQYLLTRRESFVS